MRYIPLTQQDQDEMLTRIGAQSTESLFSDIDPGIRRGEMSKLPPSKSESELRSFFHQTAQANIDPMTWKSYLGAGCYDHYIPSIVNQLALRGEFLTAYTPYQGEISQGTLQAVFEFQSMIVALTGMEVANASMYEGASSCAEAVLMSLRVNKGRHVYLSSALHPDYQTSVISYLSDYDVEIHLLDVDEKGQTIIEGIQEDTSCIVLGQPNFYGVIENVEKSEKIIHDSGALMIIATQEAMSWAMLPSLGGAKADIVVGDGQSFGVEMNYGGPHVGLFATKKKYVRSMPGRLVGKTVDEEGRPGYVLTLSTREQHIRREKATSNICTNNSLCALKACIYMATMGRKGLQDIAQTNYVLAHKLFDALTAVDGVSARYQGEFFNEFVLTLPIAAKEFVDRMQTHQIHPGVALDQFDKARTHEVLITVTETKSEQDLEHFAKLAQEVL